MLPFVNGRECRSAVGLKLDHIERRNPWYSFWDTMEIPKMNDARNGCLDLAAATAFPVVIRIFAKWGIDDDSCALILGVPKSSWNAYVRNPADVRPSDEMIERMSHILNIHATLKNMFPQTAPEGPYQWLHKPNHHPFFAGRTAMDVMRQGRISDLTDVAQRLHAALECSL